MRMPNIQEMPIHHTTWCKQGDEEIVLGYNKNDVDATYRFFLVTLGETDYSLYKGENKIKLRLDLTKKFKVNCLNLGDVPMGEALMLNLYARATNNDPAWLKRRGGTRRPQICLCDCIPKWCNIKTKEFKEFLDELNNTTIEESNPDYSKSIIFHGISFDFGLGGSHGCCKPGIYKSHDDIIFAKIINF